MSIDHPILQKLTSGQPARLIPTVAESKKEERATSILLSLFTVVPQYARTVLAEVGANVSGRSKILCLTEVSFKSEQDKKLRPDGLIIIQNGKKSWAAFIESKIGNAQLTQEQIESYLDLAKEMGVDAVITISNQFATLPTHHPVTVNKTKLRKVGLYHFSWLSLLSTAVLLTQDKQLTDPEQQYLLSEMIRYFEHPVSGVSALTKMPSSWKSISIDIQRGATLTKNDIRISEVVSAWHQLLRYLALDLSMKVGSAVTLSLSRMRAFNPEKNIEADTEELLKNFSLRAEFNVPDAATTVSLTADILRRTITFGATLQAPQDKSRVTASINWFTRQLKGMESFGLILKSNYPRRIPTMTSPLSDCLENPWLLVPQDCKDLPTTLEVTRIIDLAGKFGGSRTFIEECSRELPNFYGDVVQNLVKWIPPAPKVKEVKEEVKERKANYNYYPILQNALIAPINIDRDESQ
mgnify:CR=1 FL=1